MDGGEEVAPTHPGCPAAVYVVRGRLIQSMTTTAAGHRQSHQLSFPQAEADRRLEDCRREWEEVVILTFDFFNNFDYSTWYPLSTMSNISHNFIEYSFKIYPLINQLIN